MLQYSQTAECEHARLPKTARSRDMSGLPSTVVVSSPTLAVALLLVAMLTLAQVSGLSFGS